MASALSWRPGCTLPVLVTLGSAHQDPRAHHTGVHTGVRRLVNSLPSVCLKSLRLAPLREAALGQVGVGAGGALPLKFTPQQTFPGWTRRTLPSVA